MVFHLFDDDHEDGDRSLGDFDVFSFHLSGCIYYYLIKYNISIFCNEELQYVY